MLTALLLLAATAAPPAAAAGPCGSAGGDLCVKALEVGWEALYEERAGRRVAGRLRIAVTGAEEVPGLGPARWLEVTTTAVGGEVTTATLVVDRKGGGLRTLRAVTQARGMPPVEVPVGTGGQALPLPPAASGLTRGEALGTRTIQTPAGRFQATGYRVTAPGGQTSTAWFSPAAGPFQLVKSEGAGQTLVLIALSRGARSRLQGQPVKLPRHLLERLARERPEGSAGSGARKEGAGAGAGDRPTP